LDAGAPSHVLTDVPDAVRLGRRFVEARLLEAGADELVDDAALIASELLANAVQHGAPPVAVSVDATPRDVLIEVRDASRQTPIRARPGTDNMTGRGLMLVDRLSASWGIRLESAGGKTVWARLSSREDGSAARDGRPAEEAGGTHVQAHGEIVSSSPDDVMTHPTEERFPVTLGDVPTDLLIEAKSHIDNLVREFSLIATGSVATGVEIPPHLARLVNTVVHGFGEARGAIRRQAIAAAERGAPRTSLTLSLPLSAADAGEAYLAALDEADSYARAARLLTLETPPDHRVFRRWYVEAVVDQLRRAARGEPPSRPVPFEQQMLAEIRRLSSLQRTTDRAARLQRVSAALARARTPKDVAQVVVSEGVDALEAAGGSLLIVDDDGLHLAVPGWVGYHTELVDQLRSERLDAPLPAATALRTGHPVWLESRETRDRLFPALQGFEPRTVAMCAAPLVVGDRALGALRISFDTPRLFDDDERSFVLALAAATAQALDRSERYLAERASAVQLQRALLPPSIPIVPGWDIAAHYSPAGNQEVGGDWYDVIPLADGRVIAIVGDVMGRGVDAAAAMAQMRASVRAFVTVDPEPDAVLGRMDDMFDTLHLDQFVTVFYLLADSARGSVRFANAGHLPPLILDSDGTARRLDGVPGLPLGAGGEPRTATDLTLAEGMSLVVMTDGLVERRGEDIDACIDRLLPAGGRNADGSASAIARAIIKAAPTDDALDDDVTLLVLRRPTASS
jgi:serine phosphatase RsbU (regulator of sigma subunit)/anti-sigma regulatory factor (Ser/Thr protein kinase)